MNVKLDLDRVEDTIQVAALQNTAVQAPAPSVVEKSLDDAAEAVTSVPTPIHFSADMTHEGSDFVVCPTASISDSEYGTKVNAFANYTAQFPTEPQGIQNLMLYAHNMADASALNAKMKKELIENIQKATMNSTQRASTKGYQGLKGQKASTQFMKDVLAPFKPVSKNVNQAEMVHQTLLAVSGNLIMTSDDKAHPPVAQIHAQNRQLVDSMNGVSAPNSLGHSKTPAPAPAPAQNSTPAESPLVRPVLPPTGAPAVPDFTTSAASGVGLKGVKDYYAKLLEYLHAHPGDITAMQYMMDFLVQISNLYKGNIPADIQQILDGGSSGHSGALDAIASMLPRLAQYAFFAGYGDSSFNGIHAMQGYVDDMLDRLGGASNTKYTAAMKSLLQSKFDRSHIQFYANQHTDAKTGRLYYQVGSSNDILQPTFYYWDNKDSSGQPLPDGDTMTSQYFITQIINYQNPDGSTTPDPFNVGLDSDLNEIESTYRVSALSDLLAQYKGDPLTAITLWIMQVYDNQYQSQESGLNETTDDLTNMTNEIATRLSTLAQNIGFTGYDPVTGAPNGQKMTGAEAEEFARTLSNGSVLMNSMYQLNGISSSWDNNVFKDICDIKLSDPCALDAQGRGMGHPAYPLNHFPATVGQLLYGTAPDTGLPYTSDEKATFLSTMNLAPPPVPTTTPPGYNYPTAPSLSQGYQQTVGDLQQAGSLITGRSKTVSLQLQQVSDCDSQDINAWAKMLQDLAQFIIKGPITAQKQN